MVSFHELQQLLLLSHDNGFLNDEELLLLYDEFQPKNPNFLHTGERLNLDEMNDAECFAEFRVHKRHLERLCDVLEIPEEISCYQRSISSGLEGLCIVLKRLAYPCRYSDMISRFGLPVPVTSMICNEALDHIYDVHNHRITQWNHAILSPPALQEYSNAVYAKGAALQNCFGFVDGTVRPICRPGEHQRTVYNGHKRVHALKFQCVALPNGLIGNIYGPVGKLLSLYTVVICTSFSHQFIFNITIC